MNGSRAQVPQGSQGLLSISRKFRGSLPCIPNFYGNHSASDRELAKNIMEQDCAHTTRNTQHTRHHSTCIYLHNTTYRPCRRGQHHKRQVDSSRLCTGLCLSRTPKSCPPIVTHIKWIQLLGLTRIRFTTESDLQCLSGMTCRPTPSHR